MNTRRQKRKSNRFTIKNIKKTSLDEYNFSHEIGFIKIDVEGHELEIIRGGKNFLKHHKPVMLIEIEERHTGKSPVDIIDEICCLLYTSPSPRDRQKSRMPSSA